MHSLYVYTVRLYSTIILVIIKTPSRPFEGHCCFQKVKQMLAEEQTEELAIAKTDSKKETEEQRCDFCGRPFTAEKSTLAGSERR